MNRLQRHIYMAGKISKGDWREEAVGRNEIGTAYQDKQEWEIVPIGRHMYTGPFFVGCDHGCYHGDGSHGVGVGQDADGYCMDVQAPPRRHIVSQCLHGIMRADTFFAWIDAPDCYGTIAELGFATRLAKDIWVAGPERYEDMWFLYELATDTTFDYTSPIQAIDHFLKRHSRINYHEYITSLEWRQKAEAAKRRAGQRCQVCNRPRSEVTLDAHHRTYERLGDELPEDITVLCRDCHELFSKQGKLAGSK